MDAQDHVGAGADQVLVAAFEGGSAEIVGREAGFEGVEEGLLASLALAIQRYLGQIRGPLLRPRRSPRD